MSITTICAMLNMELYHFEVTLNKPYEDVKASDVLEVAMEFVVEYIKQQRKSWIVADVKNQLLLHFLKEEDTFVINPVYPPGDPISEEYPNHYSRLAADWYWATGYTMSSQAIDGDSLLSYWAESQDPTKVRWYILLSMPVKPMAPFVPCGLKDVVSLYKACKNYMDFVEIWTPISNSLCTHSDYGVNPVIVVSAFAEAHNMLANPHLVKLELSLEDNSFNTKHVTAHFMRAANTRLKREKQINKGLFVVLSELFNFIEIELHHIVRDKNGNMATEIDWVAFCRTPHGWMCVPFSGEGKKKCGIRGNSVLQNFFALLRNFIALTACPILIVLIEGTDLRVWTMYFSPKIYGSQLFKASLRRDLSAKQIYNLAIKLQIVWNTMRGLIDFYTHLHATTRPLTAPFLFPQPIVLLQRLTPPPPTKIMADLASLNLHIIDNVDSTRNCACSLYKGVIFESGIHVPVYVKICHEIIDGYTMAVMGEFPTPLGLEDPYPHRLNHDDIKIVKKDIGMAIRLLHEANFVHSDIRHPNMVISDGRGSLINFDSAGTEGDVAYPWSLNSTINWPKDSNILVMMPIWKNHDLHMFERAIQELNELAGHAWCSTVLGDHNTTSLQ
ncbi:hypothetical protein V8D89_002036 [Ganoderma adspersum]